MTCKCVQVWRNSQATIRHSVHTSFAGAWHAHLRNGGDDGTVPVPFAN